MIDYKGQLNMGNEALQSEKTITANEVLRTCDTKALAREISHLNALIPEQVAAAVLENFCKAAAEKMAEGFAIQLNVGENFQVKRVGIETKAYVAKTGSGDDEGEGGDSQQPGDGVDIEG